MFAMIKQPKVTRQTRSQQRSHRRRLTLDLCGPYVFDEVDSRNVSCSLRINHTRVAVNMPAEAMRKNRLLVESRKAALFVSGDQPVAFDFKPTFTDRQHQAAAITSAEMTDFDRF